MIRRSARLEAHVEHPVGFVEREDFNRGQIDRASLHVIDQPARRGDDDVGALTQRLDLRRPCRRRRKWR